MNQLFEPTPEQQLTNSLEAKCFHQEEGNNLDEKPNCEVCESDRKVQLYNLFGQRLRNDLEPGELLGTDFYLCIDCYNFRYPNGSGRAPILGKRD